MLQWKLSFAVALIAASVQLTQATPAAPLCPTVENKGLDKVALLLTCKNQSDKYACMKAENFCEPEGGLLEYAQCPDKMSVHYVKLYPTTSCAATLQDEQFCATPLGPIIQAYCNDSKCPVSAVEFGSLFSILGRCGYLAGTGTVELGSEGERVQCIKDEGGCAPNSPDTLIRYSECETKVATLLLQGATALGSGLVQSEEDCVLRLGKADDTPAEKEGIIKLCAQNFGDLVGNRYCPADFWNQDVGGIPAGPLVVGSSVLGAFGMGLVVMRYRRQSYQGFTDGFGNEFTPGFQKMPRSTFSTASTYSTMGPGFNQGGGGSFGMGGGGSFGMGGGSFGMGGSSFQGYPEAMPVGPPRQSLFSRLKSRGMPNPAGRLTGMGFAGYLGQNGFGGNGQQSMPMAAPPLPPRGPGGGPLHPPPGLGHTREIRTQRIGRPTESMMI